VTDRAAWRKSPEPWLTDGGHGCVVDTVTGSHFVYHRKLTGEPGWADREIRSTPLLWDAHGRPFVGTEKPSVPLQAGGGFRSLDLVA
ncbi:MAG TPA: hypothetical protein VNT52_07120, partial [Acidimicrobiales bacterium]|nr:hypothetical protein [Acidimicrobiales bacterium]